MTPSKEPIEDEEDDDINERVILAADFNLILNT